MELSAVNYARRVIPKRVSAPAVALYTESDQDVLLDRTSEERYSRLTSELRLTTSYLKIHPKVYWIWTHRKWCLEHIPEGPGIPSSSLLQNVTHSEGVNGTMADEAEKPVDQNGAEPEQTDEAVKKKNEEMEAENDVEGWKKEAWGRELMLVEKMLEADSRNCKSHCLYPLVLAAKTDPLLPSPRMGLQTLRVIFPTSNFPACKDSTDGS